MKKWKKVTAVALCIAMFMSVTLQSFANTEEVGDVNETIVTESIMALEDETAISKAEVEIEDEAKDEDEVEDGKETENETESEIETEAELETEIETVTEAEAETETEFEIEGNTHNDVELIANEIVSEATDSEIEKEILDKEKVATESTVKSILFGDVADRHYVFHFDLNVPDGETVDDSPYGDWIMTSTTDWRGFPNNPTCDNYVFDGWTSNVGLLFQNRQQTIDDYMSHYGYEWIKTHWLKNSVKRGSLSLINFTLDEYWNEFSSADEIEVNLTARWSQKNLDRFTINIVPNLPQGTDYDPNQFDGLSIDSSNTSITATYNVRNDNNHVEWGRGGFSNDDDENERAIDFTDAWGIINLRDQEPDNSYTHEGYWYENLGTVINFQEDEYYNNIEYEVADNSYAISKTKFTNNEITLYAVWSKQVDFNHIIAFKDDEKYIYPSQFLNDGDRVAKPADPTKSNKTFGGWYYRDSANKEVKWNFDTVLTEGGIDGNANVELYAKWNNNGGGAPITPSGGSSNNGGGGGGGVSITPGGLPSSAPAITIIEVATKTISASVSLDSATWQYDPTTYKWKLNLKNADGTNGTTLSNGFFQVSNNIIDALTGAQNQVNDTYYFDASGNMVTGWIQTRDNKWYFFENANNSEEGKMQLGWKQVSGTWYYFGADGAMLVNTTTPDGYIVDADGKLMN